MMIEDPNAGIARKDAQPRGLRRRQHRGARDLLEAVLPHRGRKHKGAGNVRGEERLGGGYGGR